MTDDNHKLLFYWMTGHKLLCERIDRHRRSPQIWTMSRRVYRQQICAVPLPNSGGCEYWQQAFYTLCWLDWLIKNNFISQMKHHAWQSLHERDAFDTEAEQISLCVQCNSTVYKRLAAVLSVWNRRHKFMFICLCLLRADSQVSLSRMGHRHFFSCWTSAACLPAA